MKWGHLLLLTCTALLLIGLALVEGQGSNSPGRGRPGNRPRGRGAQRNPNRRPNRRRPGRPRPRPSVRPTIPVSTSTECELIMVPMCRGMVSYTHTRLPNRFNHRTQVQVYRALEYMWAFMDIGCSVDFRTTACGYYLPKCTPGEAEVQLPCKETCNHARRCKKRMRQLQSRWPNQFRCKTLKPARQGNCIRPSPRVPSCQQTHLTCEPNPIPMCQNLTFSHGSLPNMFLQCNVDQIQAEMEQFRDLVDSNCSPHVRFFICGIYMPFCVRAERPFALPCREICEDVETGCKNLYSRNRGNLTWPNKFQCHRYPLSTNTQQVCASPTDVTLRTPDWEEEGEEGDEENSQTDRRRGGERNRPAERRRGGNRNSQGRNNQRNPRPN